MLQHPWLDPGKEPCSVPPPDSLPMEGLTVARGLGCPKCRYVARSPAVVAEHYYKSHGAPGNARPGRPARNRDPRPQ